MSTVSNEQIYAAIARLEARADANAEAQKEAVKALNQRIDDKFGDIQQHLARQDERLNGIDAKLGVAHDNALEALRGAKRAGAISGGTMSAAVQVGVEICRALLKP